MMIFEPDEKRVSSVDQSAEAIQLQIVVENCKVVLNFPPKSEGNIVSDIKRMMLGGAVKV